MKVFTSLLAGLLLAAPAFARWTADQPPAPKAANPAEIRASVTDPVGDNFNPGPDLTGFSATTDGTNLTMVLTFAGAIEPPPGTGGGNEVVGGIDIDTDQNGATGDPAGAIVGTFCPQPPAGFGPEFEVSLFTFDPLTGTADVLETAGFTPVGTADVTFAATSVTIVVANSVLGGDDGIADLATVIGNSATPTDCAPDGAVLASDLQGTVPPAAAVPALSVAGLMALLLLLASVAVVVMRRRAAA